jgi:hypothetical protein
VSWRGAERIALNLKGRAMRSTARDDAFTAAFTASFKL